MIQIEMDMPKSCGKCRFFTKDDCDISYCTAKSEKMWIITFAEERILANNRPSWCPLQEVKE